jgi:hypothetical protein
MRPGQQAATTVGGILDVILNNISFPAPSVRGESGSNQVSILLANNTEDIEENYYYYCDPRKGGQWRETPR